MRRKFPSKAGMNADQYYKYRDHIYADFSYRHVTDLGCLEFSGRYPDNLLEEINNYFIVAGVIARTEEYDIIHAHDWLTYPAGIPALETRCCTYSRSTSFQTIGTWLTPTIFRKLWSSSPQGFGIQKVISISVCIAMPRVKPKLAVPKPPKI